MYLSIYIYTYTDDDDDDDDDDGGGGGGGGGGSGGGDDDEFPALPSVSGVPPPCAPLGFALLRPSSGGLVWGSACQGSP